jgi:hypothetical protein
MRGSSTFSTLTSLFFLVMTAACAGSAESVPVANEPVESEEAAIASMKYYDCRGSQDDGDTMQRFELGISATRIQVTDVSKDAAPPDKGTIDRAYTPGPSYEGAIRFQGFDILESSLSSDVAHVEFIVSKEIKTRAAQGKVWMRTSGSGGGSQSYFCKSKAEKLKVDTALKSRLFCSLKPIICTNDNPPGETCLADLFVGQSASGASLKLTYLDHFGVFAQRRQQSLGASDDFNRTTRKIEGAWNDNALKLDYRGGVTYTGTFELPDGRSSKVQCNDLAMFD